MKLTNDHANFYETIKEYNTSDFTLTSETIPKGALMNISPLDDYIVRVWIYRVYPFTEAVKAARTDMVTLSNMRSDANPTTKFYISGWTPEKLAEVQARFAERVTKYAELTLKYHDATKVYNAALEAQRLEIVGTADKI